jgi:hypothetical protein
MSNDWNTAVDKILEQVALSGFTSYTTFREDTDNAISEAKAAITKAVEDIVIKPDEMTSQSVPTGIKNLRIKHRNSMRHEQRAILHKEKE